VVSVVRLVSLVRLVSAASTASAVPSIAPRRPRRLHVFGDPADAFDRVDRQLEVNSVTFTFTAFDRVAAFFIPKLRKLPSLSELVFEQVDLSSLSQLSTFAQLPQLTTLLIKRGDNPVVDHTHFRSFMLSTVPLLSTLNGRAVTAEERTAAEQRWSRLKRLYEVASHCVHARANLQSSPLPLRRPVDPSTSRTNADAGRKPSVATAGAVAATYVERVVDHAVAVDEKICQLNAVWPGVIARYEAQVRKEMNEPELLQRRYRAVAHGEHE